MSLLLGYQVGCSQENMQEQWIATISAGIEKHDKRLFDYSEKEMLLEMQPEKWGTYHFNMSVQRRVWQHNNYYAFIGLGLGYEKATFVRPFNHLPFVEDPIMILWHLNTYNKIYTPMTISFNYEIGYHWFILGNLTSDFLVHRSLGYKQKGNNRLPFKENTFELDDLHFELGINYRIGQFLVGFSSRVLNFQKIDKIIFNNLIHDPRKDQRWEWYNPLRFDFTVSYMW